NPFNAKIGDLGLARLKTEEIVESAAGEDSESILEEVESVAAYEDSSVAVVGVDQSPVSLTSKVFDSELCRRQRRGRACRRRIKRVWRAGEIWGTEEAERKADREGIGGGNRTTELNRSPAIVG
ncbi:hypothetical protein LINPERHAP2_LOCUS14694, partial [Linum perenne]